MPAAVGIVVAYAEPGRAVVRSYRLTDGATVADAIDAARVDPAFDRIEFDGLGVGIFGKAVSPTHRLTAGDRVELYRPLAADPKSARRSRARQAKRRA